MAGKSDRVACIVRCVMYGIGPGKSDTEDHSQAQRHANKAYKYALFNGDLLKCNLLCRHEFSTLRVGSLIGRKNGPARSLRLLTAGLLTLRVAGWWTPSRFPSG